ncbi:unnamed protein product [Hymenolepis diminuta]|nr:unnamed protein product [Hymenolepis diminuta]
MKLSVEPLSLPIGESKSAEILCSMFHEHHRIDKLFDHHMNWKGIKCFLQIHEDKNNEFAFINGKLDAVSNRQDGLLCRVALLESVLRGRE